MIAKIKKLCSVLGRPGGLGAFLRWKPFSSASFEVLSALKRDGLEFGTVIDAGANIGQFARASIETFPGASVYSIEPHPRIVETLRANLAGESRVQIFQSAVGRADGSITFHLNRYDQISSALRLRTDQAVYEKNWAEFQEVEVPLTRLDTLFAGRTLAGPVLLKLDLQGFELEALKGATETLGKCDYLIAETVFECVYESEPLFEELRGFLAAHGFRFLRPLGFNRKTNGVIFEMDALFQRESRASEAPAPRAEVCGAAGREPSSR